MTELFREPYGESFLVGKLGLHKRAGKFFYGMLFDPWGDRLFPNNMKSISVNELQSLVEEHANVALIDVRTPVEFGEIHATMARNVPLDAIDPNQFMAERGSGEGDPIYFICRSGSRAQRAGDLFAKAGFEDTYCVTGGTDAWAAAGLPVVRGRKAMSLERQVRIAAGSLVLVGIALGLGVNPYFFGVSAFVGAGLVFAGITDWCGMGLLLARMPWNRKTG